MEGCGGSFSSAEVQKYGLIKSIFQTITSLFSVGGVICCTIANPSLRKYTDDMVVFILQMCRGGVSGGLPQNFFC